MDSLLNNSLRKFIERVCCIELRKDPLSVWNGEAITLPSDKAFYIVSLFFVLFHVHFQRATTFILTRN